MFKKFENKMSLRKRFSLLFIFLILVPIVLLNIFVASVQLERASNQHLTSTKYEFSPISQEFISDVKFAFNYASIIYEDYDINMFLNTKFKNSKDFYEKYSSYYINKTVDFFANQSPNIKTPKIYSDNATMTGETEILIQIDDTVRNQDWYIEFQESGKDVFFHVDEKTRYASVVRNLNLNESSSIENIIRIVIDLDYVADNLSNIDIDTMVYLFGENSLPLYSWDNGYTPTHESSYYRLVEKDLTSDDLILVFNNNIDNYGDMSLVFISKTAPFFSLDVIISTAISLLFTLLASLLFMRTMEKNYINKIESLVSSIDVNEFIRTQNPDDDDDNDDNPKPPKMKTNNELTIVAQTLENMSTQIHALIKEAYTLEMEKNQADIRRKQSELNSLLSQINPHYLFNVLNAIRLKCIIKGEKETAKIILYVSKIFRQSITWNEDIITLHEELNFIKEYLAIEKYRFEDKLSYELNIKEELFACEVPKMTLQPFVENACVHGVQNTIGNGLIVIDVEEVDIDHYSFTITNPAANFSSAIKDQIIGYSVGNFDVDTKSVGLKNTFARLRHYYDDFKFDIIQREGVVSFQLILPKQSTKKQTDNGNK